jgi:hypothetical protein
LAGFFINLVFSALPSALVAIGLSYLAKAQALQLPESPFRRVKSLPHGGRAGSTEVYVSTRHTTPDLNALRQQGIPAKVSNAINTQL